MAQLSEIPEEAAIATHVGDKQFVPRGPLHDLLILRQQYPFLPIMPLPPRVRTVIVTNIAQAVDLVIPDAAVLMQIRGSGVYYMSSNGGARVPDATDSQAARDSSNENMSFYPADGMYWYIGGMKSISIAAPVVNTIVTAVFFSPVAVQG